MWTSGYDTETRAYKLIQTMNQVSLAACDIRDLREGG